ncbi:hypothetical protein FE784_30615 [Paenibacillus hemerocallicola]|uniref:Glucuronyl hydrolase n=1 Tax=Paenibacillus hemerocallicola TaxID=1172614 RepID=A0A5C4T034_9BACL|nr:glycoside hydrolase family 88 protein [Paenibacillus hemerocallicola]TNJ62422.1 hypothetical protein FE784_30615 [Paenibacillus hemerocallicola]
MKGTKSVRPGKYPLLCEFAPALQVPEGKRVPFGWKSVAIDSSARGNRTRLRWPQTANMPGCAVRQAFLRICTACDVREEKRIEVTLAGSGKLVGTFDIRYAYVHQIFEIPIPGEDMDAIINEGLDLRMAAGEQPFWMFCDPASSEIPDTLQPHVLLVGQNGGNDEIGENSEDDESGRSDRLAEFYVQLKSFSSIQPFGWLEGCVLDGLFQLDAVCPDNGWLDALLGHLRLYFPAGDKLVIENHLSDISDGRFYSHESTLPLALITRVWPDHPIVEDAISFWQTNKHGMTTEGCYTVGYPLAVIAGQRGRADLAELSVRILLERKENLAAEWGVWQRQYMYRNWARACAWYTLGFTRSAIALREANMALEQLETVEQEIRRMAQVMMLSQRPDGLWSCFIDEEATGPDTSGSAGIAAALALEARHGILPDTVGAEAMAAAERAFQALRHCLTPDGLLSGSAQNNRGGEALQKSGYRTISQMAMGLMGQLAAALPCPISQLQGK